MEEERPARSPVRLSNLAIALVDRYRRTGSGSDLNWAVKLNEKALGLCPPGHKDRAMSMNNLADALHRRYYSMGTKKQRSDIERAINLRIDALEEYSPDQKDRHVCSSDSENIFDTWEWEVVYGGKAMFLLDRLALALVDRYISTSSICDLEWAIELNTAALKLLPPSRTHRDRFLNNLANALHKRYDRMGVLHDLERAIELHSDVLTFRPTGHRDRSESAQGLALALIARYHRSHNLNDLERCVELSTEVLELHPPGHGSRGLSLIGLATVLMVHYDRMTDLIDLERAIVLLGEALDLHPPGHIFHSSSLSLLASALRSRYEITGTPDDLERAIELHMESLALCPPGHVDRVSSLSNLAVALRNRYDGMGSISDLERVIELHTEALMLCPSGHADRGFSLSNLAAALDVRYNRMNTADDLERIIEYRSEALMLCPPGHKDHIVSLGRLANAFMVRFRRTSALNDLDQSIELYKEALVLCSSAHVDRGSYLNELGTALGNRYKSMRNPEDLMGSIILYKEALALLPRGHEDRSIRLSNLATALCELSCDMRQDSSSLRNLDQSIELYSEALAVHPTNNKYRRSILSNLGIAYQYRFHHKMRDIGSLNGNDMERSIELFEEALALCPPGDADRSGYLITLAMAQRESDSEQSIKLYKEALALIPPGHKHRRSAQCLLSLSLLSIENRNSDEIFRSFKERSLDCTSGLHASLFDVRMWVFFGRSFSHYDTVSEAYDTANKLVLHHLPIWPTIKDQYRFLRREAGILQFPVDAAAHALEKGDIKKAVECLDVGRSLLWSELGRFRDPLLQSELLDRKLAEDFDTACSQLQTISTAEVRFDYLSTIGISDGEGDTSRLSYDDLLRRKRKLMDQYNSVVHRIKETPGLEGFLEPLSFGELQVAAKEGPVIVVNCSEYGSHVIFIFVDRPPSVMQLDESFRRTAQQLHERLEIGTERLEIGTNTKISSAPPERIIKDMTKFLWEDVVEGVVKKLKAEKVPEGSRIWWCPTSFLTKFPFHAAGNKKNSLVNSYVSSYTPTLKALIDARKSSFYAAGTVGPEPPPKILVVGQTQESSGLPAASKELEVMRNLASVIKCLDQENATGKAVLEGLQSHNWAHFICHGRVSASPFDSSLILHEGNLSFNDIIKAHLSDARFAFLAACHTAEQSPAGLPDEVLHLSAAMFFTGFRSVVGTMWKMKDEDGPEIARMFYEEMLRDDSEESAAQKPRHTRAAYALWKVTKYLKDVKKVNIDRWANFVHIGT